MVMIKIKVNISRCMSRRSSLEVVVSLMITGNIISMWLRV